MRLGTNVAFNYAEEARMKLIGAAFGIALMCSIGAGAQTATTKVDGKNKVTVKDGKEITITGCVERNPGGGYMLTDSSTGGMKYALVTEDDLSKHVGHKVEVKGNATDRGDAKMKTETKAKGTAGSDSGDKAKVETKTKAEGNLDLHYLGLKSLKMVSASCM
jgi:ribosome maturation factor RimP